MLTVKKMKKIFQWFLYPLRQLILLIPQVRASDIDLKIRKMESNGKLEEARSLRKKWLCKLSPSYRGPLWCSEGADLLYNKKNYEGALTAFEKSIAVKYVPSSDPLLMYYGASCAALKSGNQEKAQKYFQEGLTWYNHFKSGNKFADYISRYEETHMWLQNNLSQTG